MFRLLSGKWDDSEPRLPKVFLKTTATNDYTCFAHYATANGRVENMKVYGVSTC